MSSVIYKGETKDPKTLTGYVDNQKFMQQTIKPGDMLINNKTQEVAIAHTLQKNERTIYFHNINTNTLLVTETGSYDFGTTNNTQRCITYDMLGNKDWEYIPVEQIKNLNFDIEMK